MHISPTPELEELIRHKVDSGLHNDACEALHFIDEHAQMIEQIKLACLRHEVTKGALQAECGEFSKHSVNTLLEELNSRELDD